MNRIFLLVLILILASCGQVASIKTLPDPSPDQNIPRSERGLSLTLAEDTFTESPSVIETFIRNDGDLDFEYGEFYHIELKEDEQWYMITYSDSVFLKNPRFADFGSVLEAGDIAHQLFSIDALGVRLTPGEYRLVKTFSSKGESFNEISIAVPFSVE